MCAKCAKDLHTATECRKESGMGESTPYNSQEPRGLPKEEQPIEQPNTARLSHKNLRSHTKETGAQERVEAKVDRLWNTEQTIITYVSTPVDIGQSILEVGNTAGFKPGDTILLKQSPNEYGHPGGMESRVITRIASLHLDRPTTLHYAIGSEVRLIEAGPGFYDQTLTPPFRMGLGAHDGRQQEASPPVPLTLGPNRATKTSGSHKQISDGRLRHPRNRNRRHPGNEG
jgi:hypothetical protein